MFELRVLGGLRLEGPSGPVTGRAAQRRRLALLARLAVPRGAPLTRDILCALLWPDSSQEQARQSLSAALYDLRQVLGDETLHAVGDEIRLDTARLWCDALVFEEAASAGRFDQAASLYAGPLLEGVHFGADGAEEWERWVDGERARLARLHVVVLERLADDREAAGNLPSAVDVLLRLAGEDPYGARTVVRLMTALERLGERPRAIQQARLYAGRVREDLDAEPDPAVLALEQRLRREPAPRATTAGHTAGKAAVKASEPAPEPPRRRLATAPAAILFAGVLVLLGSIGGYALYRARSARAGVITPTIAVLPFENLSSDRENAHFVDGVSDDLLTRLARVPRLRVISRISVQRYKGSTKAIGQIARELGATHVLEGSIRRAGDTVRINAQLIDARTDRHIWAERYDRNLREVFGVQTEIAEAIAEALVATLTPGDKALLAAGGTSDPLAFDGYVRGQQFAKAGLDDSAKTYFRRASAVDPGYALPHGALALIYARGSSDGPPPHRDSAIAEARRALELDPRSTLARRALAQLYMSLGQCPEADRQLRSAIQIDPNDVDALSLLVVVLYCEGRTGEAARLRVATVRLDPLNGASFELLGWMFEKSGDLDLAIRAARRAVDLGYFGAYGSLAQFYMNKRDFDAARAVATEATVLWGPVNPFTIGVRAEAAARQGRWAEADRLIQRPFVVSAESHLFPGYVALKLGKRARADSLLGAFERELRERVRQGFSATSGEARLAAVRGQRDLAVRYLRQMRAAGYAHCLPTGTLYYSELEGNPGYEEIVAGMCAQAARGRREGERSGLNAEAAKLLSVPAP